MGYGMVALNQVSTFMSMSMSEYNCMMVICRGPSLQKGRSRNVVTQSWWPMMIPYPIIYGHLDKDDRIFVRDSILYCSYQTVIVMFIPKSMSFSLLFIYTWLILKALLIKVSYQPPTLTADTSMSGKVHNVFVIHELNKKLCWFWVRQEFHELTSHSNKK